MFGWRGRLLRVDLSQGSVSYERLDPKTAKSRLGGRGLGAFLLKEEPCPSTAPLSAKNRLIFATGPLTGTLAPNGGRYTVVARTPAGGEAVSASISGRWGAELKFAGFDAVIFEGAAKQPVYLWVKDGSAELRSAAHLWGKTAAATSDALLKETDPGAAVSRIGPAGENKVDCSVIVSGSFSAAGGNGAGAAMGSKNLKAVAVRGTEGFRVADREEFLKAASELRSWMKNKPIAATGSIVFDSVLLADSLAWGTAPPDFKQARTRGCFSCATSFSLFESNEGKKSIRLLAGIPPPELKERLRDYRLFVDYGLDFAAARPFMNPPENGGNGCSEEMVRTLAAGGKIAGNISKTKNRSVDRGPCIAAGYAIVPRLAAGGGGNEIPAVLTAVLDSTGLCPFLAAGVGMETIARLLTAATGVVFTKDEIEEAGQRIAGARR